MENVPYITLVKREYNDGYIKLSKKLLEKLNNPKYIEIKKKEIDMNVLMVSTKKTKTLKRKANKFNALIVGETMGSTKPIKLHGKNRDKVVDYSIVELVCLFSHIRARFPALSGQGFLRHPATVSRSIRPAG